MNYSNDDRRVSAPGLCCLLLLAASVFFPAVAPAAETAAGNAQLPSKVHITAERMVSNTRERYAEFSGNVNATQGDTTINADALKIYYKEGADPVSGSGTQGDFVRRIVATGRVRIQVEDRVAYGERAVYTSDEELLILTGDKARIESEGNYIHGEEIVMTRKTGQISVTGTGDRVEAVFESEGGRGRRPNSDGKSQEKTSP